MSSDTDRLHDLIQADLDGALPPAGRAELARLLLKDPAARCLHDEFRQTDRLLRDIGSAEPPAGLREAILAGPASSMRAGKAGPQSGWPAYRFAAVILGGMLIVGLGYLVRDGDAPAKELQGSLGVAPRNAVSLRAEGVEVGASLVRSGTTQRLELQTSTTVPCEIIARIDPGTTSYVGKTGEARLIAQNGQVQVLPALGKHSVVLEFSGASPIRLELRASGRLLGEGRLESAP